MRAVVIGAGIAGTAATLLLAHAGVPTVLVEKNRRLGGSCSGYDKQGFHVDIGTHMFCRGPRGPLGDVLRATGEEDAISFRRTRDIAEVRFPVRRGGAGSAPSAGGLFAAGDGVEKIAVPADLHRMPQFLYRLARALDLTPQQAAQAVRFFLHLLAMSDAEAERWDGRTVEELVMCFTDHSPTIGMFGFLLGLYFILPYWEVSAGEAIWSFRRMILDNHLSYPKGGAIAIPSAYARLAQARGAEVRAGTGVRRIVIEGGAVKGVELSDGTVLPADVVVSTSSVRTTVMRLAGPEHFPAAYVDAAAKIKGSYIAVQAKIALKKRLVHAGALVGGVGEEGTDLLNVSSGDLRSMFDMLASGRIPPVVPFYCPVPTNFDPDLAPPGHQLLTVCAVAPTSDVALHDPAPAWEEAMLRTLRRVVPGLDEHIVFVDRFSVDFIEKWIGKEFGPAVSTGQTPEQVGKNRPAVFTPVRGLYMAGCGAGARGVGTELAAASAMECVDRLLVDAGRRPVSSASRRRGARAMLRRAAVAPVAWVTRP